VHIPIAKTTNSEHTLINWFVNSSTQSFTELHSTLYKERHKIWFVLKGSGCLSNHDIEHRPAHISAELEWLARRWFRLGSPFFEANRPERSKPTNGLSCRNTILCPSVISAPPLPSRGNEREVEGDGHVNILDDTYGPGCTPIEHGSIGREEGLVTGSGTS
jgi:hypothetical protein